MDGLLAIGFEFRAALRIVRRYPSKLVAQWTDVTQAAMERFGPNHFRVSPMAYFVDSIRKADQGTRTPPDWWQESRRKERRNQQPTEAGRQVLSRLMDEVFGPDRAATSNEGTPQPAGDLLRNIR